jgi:leader peptidase (prepilin peptidase) / N-methyltransferase
VLRGVELIPLISHIVQRGQCRRCGGAIGARQLLIESVCALWGGAALAVEPSAYGGASALTGWLLITLAVLDGEHFWLPTPLTAALFGLGLLSEMLHPAPDLIGHLIGAGAGFASLSAVRLGYRRLRGRDGMGAGDPLLLGGVGAWLGWQLLPMVLLLASVAGLTVALLRHFSGKAVHRDDPLPLGTLIVLAALWLWLLPLDLNGLAIKG